jgi:hypothetical protein
MDIDRLPWINLFMLLVYTPRRAEAFSAPKKPLMLGVTPDPG